VIGAEAIIYLEHDTYYLGLDQLPAQLRQSRNFDHPEALDNALFIEHLRALQARQPIERPIYDFTRDCRAAETYRIAPKPIILVDGILIFAIAELRSLFDIKVFIDAEADVRLARRLRRDILERGRSPESVLDQYLATVRPMHKQFVEPSKKYADIIIHGKIEKHNTGLDLLVTKIRAHLHEMAQPVAPPSVKT